MCVSINGANSLGSNSLGELLVFGARAGKAAVEYIANCAGPSEIQLLAQATDEEHRLEQHFRKDNGTERIAKLREEMQRTMESGCGIYRERGTLIESANKISELKERAQNVRVDDQGRTFNTRLTAALELGFMLDIAETIVHCALNREESRGVHQRRDFTKRDESRYLAHSLVSRAGEGPPRVD
jgi:fumarate reductase flavoprotein subunit